MKPLTISSELTLTDTQEALAEGLLKIYIAMDAERCGLGEMEPGLVFVFGEWPNKTQRWATITSDGRVNVIRNRYR